MEIVRAKVMGFCQGVKNAIAETEKALKHKDKENYKCVLFGDTVHNSFVIDKFKEKGAIVTKDISLIDSSTVVVIRAHGNKDNIRDIIIKKGALIADATCPVVLKNQKEIRNSLNTIIVGYPLHSEVETLLGSGNGNKVLISSAFDVDKIDSSIDWVGIVQTTFSSSILEGIKKRCEERRIKVKWKSGICQASIKRRKALLDLTKEVDLVVVVGDKSSANCTELKNLAEEYKPTFFSSEIDSIKKESVQFAKIGITASASTSEEELLLVERRLRELWRV